MMSGKIIFEYKKLDTPLINVKGLILNFQLESADTIAAINTITEKSIKNVLTIENKETFFALGSPQKSVLNEKLINYDCFLYTSGYPNRAAVTLIKILASSDFTFYHAGDLDPDGILILQFIQDIVNYDYPEKPVTPVRMNIYTFDQYRAWARPLTKPSLSQIKKISEKTRTIPEFDNLIKRIEETGMGIEQEIIDYR